MLIPFDYLFEKYNISCTGLLHCGASYCQERDMYERLNIPEVFWVEAIPEVYEQGLINLRNYKKQFILNACVSDEDGKDVVFNISNNESQSSSFLELEHHLKIHPEVRYVDSIKLRTVRLDTLLTGFELSRINFGNFDLQGSELLALKGLGELIKYFDYFYIEVNKKETYKGCALVEDIDNFLSDFERVETGEWVADTWTDALYIRKTLLK